MAEAEILSQQKQGKDAGEGAVDATGEKANDMKDTTDSQSQPLSEDEAKLDPEVFVNNGAFPVSSPL